MAIYRCEIKNISRGQGRSCVAAAAYRAGETLEDKRQGIEHSYTDKSDILHSEIMTPDNAPEWMKDRSQLWNGVDAAEKRKDARTCREVLIALPRELSNSDQIDAVRDFVKTEIISRGLVADIALHNPKAMDGGEQPHAHILITTRCVEQDGFSKKKDREFSDKPEAIRELRAKWGQAVNQSLERAGRSERVDHRRLDVQCAEARQAGDWIKAEQLDRPPETKIGPVGTKILKEGRRSKAADAALQIRTAARELTDWAKDAWAEVKELAHATLEATAPTPAIAGISSNDLNRLRKAGTNVVENRKTKGLDALRQAGENLTNRSKPKQIKRRRDRDQGRGKGNER